MVVVSDTSVFSNFIHLDRLDLLAKLFGEIYIPPAVSLEVLELSKQDINISSFQEAKWIKVQQPQNNAEVEILLDTLDQGEAESIVLAVELEADFLLVDELLGRKEAKKQGLSIIGTLGILLKAKKEGYVSVLKPLIDTLVEKGFWIHQSLYQKILSMAGEK